MGHRAPATSRQSFLGSMTVSPVVGYSGTPPVGEPLASIYVRCGDKPTILARSREGRSLSRSRYHNAESFYRPLDFGHLKDRREILYRSGIVVQLALSAHLLDVGFPDEWNARHIRLDVAKALVYSNATGFAFDRPDMVSLATTLSPYWKWGHLHRRDESCPDDGGFTLNEIRLLLGTLLDHVRDVTGHPRPSGWEREQREAHP